MCTLVRTADVTVIIDPGVALGPKRYGLPPHPKEVDRMKELWEDIKKGIEESDVAVVTHYHYDHHSPEETDLLKGKRILLKHPKEKINRSQMGRAAYFIEKLDNYDFADGKEYEFGNTLLKFSQPVFHGANSRLGYVIELYIDDGDSFAFSSDVEGPIHGEQVEFLIETKAETVFIDGPMTYMLGYRFSARSLENSIENLITLMERTDVKDLVLDHHLTRDINFREKINEVRERGEEIGVRVMTAAEFSGKENLLLEALRKELYQNY
jgi:hypothetical protein